MSIFRVRRGVPTGGQFAGVQHDESDVTLEPESREADQLDWLRNRLEEIEELYPPSYRPPGVSNQLDKLRWTIHEREQAMNDRQPSGVPTGGQFAPQTHDEGDVSLEVPLSGETESNEELEATLAELEAEFEENGGRGVELAEEIDALRAIIANRDPEDHLRSLVDEYSRLEHPNQMVTARFLNETVGAAKKLLDRSPNEKFEAARRQLVNSYARTLAADMSRITPEAHLIVFEMTDGDPGPRLELAEVTDRHGYESSVAVRIRVEEVLESLDDEIQWVGQNTDYALDHGHTMSFSPHQATFQVG